MTTVGLDGKTVAPEKADEMLLQNLVAAWMKFQEAARERSDDFRALEMNTEFTLERFAGMYWILCKLENEVCKVKMLFMAGDIATAIKQNQEAAKSTLEDA